MSQLDIIFYTTAVCGTVSNIGTVVVFLCRQDVRQIEMHLAMIQEKAALFPAAN
jgi:hypothetical protein